MDTEFIYNAIMNYDLNTLFLILKLFTAAVVIVVMKYFVECVAGYITFKLDEYVHTGTPVEVFGKKGRIRKTNLFVIVVETECGFIPISTRDWKSSKYIVLKDKWDFHRRKEDHMEVNVKLKNES